MSDASSVSSTIKMASASWVSIPTSLLIRSRSRRWPRLNNRMPLVECGLWPVPSQAEGRSRKPPACVPLRPGWPALKPAWRDDGRLQGRTDARALSQLMASDSSHFAVPSALQSSESTRQPQESGAGAALFATGPSKSTAIKAFPVKGNQLRDLVKRAGASRALSP